MMRYSTLVFDCDGVLLDSNRIKTEAFHRVSLRFGESAADALVSYHLANGGISRYRKLEYLFSNILKIHPKPGELEMLAEEYGEFVFDGLVNCRVATGLHGLRETTGKLGWMIVSGGDQTELRQVFRMRGLDTLFDLGIFGSPDSKDAILCREFEEPQRRPALFLGDSRYDHVASTSAGLDFIFVHGWSEFDGWQNYCSTHNIPTVEELADIAPHLESMDVCATKMRASRS